MSEQATPINELRIQTICLIILSAGVIAGALYLLRPVLIPFVLAIFITYCLTPVIDLQTKYLKIRRSLAVVAALFLSCLALVFFSITLSTTITDITNQLSEYQGTIKESMDRIIELLPLERFGVETDEITAPLFENPDATIANALSQTLGGIMNVLSNGALVLIFLIFMMWGKSSDEEAASPLLEEVQHRITRYIITLIFISVLTGVSVGLVLYLLGIKFAVMFGFLTFLLNFIPSIGSIAATLLPIPVAFMTPDISIGAKIMVVAIPSAIQFVLGNIVQPKIMGRSLDLHPVTLMFSLMFFGMIWGVVGMFLATPITAVLKIVLERIEFTRPLAGLLAGRLSNLSI